MAKKYEYTILPKTIKARGLLAMALLGGLLAIGGYFAVLILSLEASLDPNGSDIPPGAAKLVFANSTDSVFCYDYGRTYDISNDRVIVLPASATRAGGSCGAEVEPNGRTVLYPQCISGPEPGYMKGIPIDVFLSIEGSAPAYSGSARCDEETTFVIARHQDRLVVEKTVTQALEDQPPPSPRSD